MIEFVLTKSNNFWLKELSAQCSKESTKDIIHQLREADVDSLGKLRLRNVNKILIGNLISIMSVPSLIN